mmetsp:Transcript_62850/g.163092  ORF Transcript_62850/g.163092 Transcript_62850/m.163092 type:complete len:540 (-) Transcript_62850:448-2067(-)
MLRVREPQLHHPLLLDHCREPLFELQQLAGVDIDLVLELLHPVRVDEGRPRVRGLQIRLHQGELCRLLGVHLVVHGLQSLDLVLLGLGLLPKGLHLRGQALHLGHVLGLLRILDLVEVLVPRLGVRQLLPQPPHLVGLRVVVVEVAKVANAVAVRAHLPRHAAAGLASHVLVLLLVDAAQLALPSRGLLLAFALHDLADRHGVRQLHLRLQLHELLLLLLVRLEHVQTELFKLVGELPVVVPLEPQLLLQGPLLVGGCVALEQPCHRLQVVHRPPRLRRQLRRGQLGLQTLHLGLDLLLCQHLRPSDHVSLGDRSNLLLLRLLDLLRCRGELLYELGLVLLRLPLQVVLPLLARFTEILDVLLVALHLCGEQGLETNELVVQVIPLVLDLRGLLPRDAQGLRQIVLRIRFNLDLRHLRLQLGLLARFGGGLGLLLFKCQLHLCKLCASLLDDDLHDVLNFLQLVRWQNLHDLRWQHRCRDRRWFRRRHRRTLARSERRRAVATPGVAWVASAASGAGDAAHVAAAATTSAPAAALRRLT